MFDRLASLAHFLRMMRDEASRGVRPTSSATRHVQRPFSKPVIISAPTGGDTHWAAPFRSVSVATAEDDEVLAGRLGAGAAERDRFLRRLLSRHTNGYQCHTLLTTDEIANVRSLLTMAR